MSAEPEKSGSGLGGVTGFVKSVIDEGHRVVWPSREETTQGTVTVLIMVVLLGAYLGAVDFLTTNILGRLPFY